MSPGPVFVEPVERFEESPLEALVRDTSPSAEIPPARLVLGNGRTFLLDPEDPRYSAWARVLKRRAASHKHVYLETDSTEQQVTRIELPRARRIADLVPVPELRGFEIRAAGSPMPLFLPADQALAFLDLLRSAKLQGHEVLITSDPDTYEVLHVDPFPALERARKAALAALRPLPAPLVQLTGTLTVKQVLAEFEFLTNQTDIPFDYPVDCCTARAHEMFRLLAVRGFRCRKIWNYGGEGRRRHSRLQLFTLRVRRGFVLWNFHVAPLVRVSLLDGSEVEMVLDPSMFSRPVRIPDWVALQHDSTAVQEIDEPDIFERWLHGTEITRDPQFAQARDDLDDHIELRDSR